MLLEPAEAEEAVPLWLVAESQWSQWLAGQKPAAAWLKGHGFQAERGKVATLPDPGGAISAAVVGLGALGAPGDPAQPSLWDGAACAERLPPGNYALATQLPANVATQFALGWLLGCYRQRCHRCRGYE